MALQGHTLGSGDFLATWAVELVVHQLDLSHALDVTEPPSAALVLARQTLEALLEVPKPAGWLNATGS